MKRLPSDRDLALLHHLEQGALDLGGRAVDLVGEQEVGEDGAERRPELAGLLVVDPRPDEVGGNEVGRELDPLELATDRLGQCLDGHRLGQARDALDQDVPAREQRDDQALQEVVLADDDLLDLVEQPLHRRCAFLAGWHDPLASSSLVRWQAGGTAGDIDRHGETDADEDLVVGRVDERGHDADDVAVPVQQRSAGVARVDGGIDLDQPVQDLVAVGQLERAVDARDDADAHRAAEAERAAQRICLAALAHRIRIAQDRRHEVRRRLDARERRRCRSPAAGRRSPRSNSCRRRRSP